MEERERMMDGLRWNEFNYGHRVYSHLKHGAAGDGRA
jgi:hypothetical protein